MNDEGLAGKALSLWMKVSARTRTTYTENEFQVACDLAASADPFFKFIGKLAKLDSAKPEASEFADLMQEECSKGFERAKEYAHDILYLQFGLPREVLERPEIRNFILAAARSSKVFCRINSAHLLHVLAEEDRTASVLLQGMLTDPDDRVKQNAEALLRNK